MLELDSIGTLVRKEASKGPFFINKRVIFNKMSQQNDSYLDKPLSKLSKIEFL